MLPRPVYQALPGLYVASGTASVFYLDIWTGKVSGLVLIAAGLIVLYWRMAPPLLLGAIVRLRSKGEPTVPATSGVR